MASTGERVVEGAVIVAVAAVLSGQVIGQPLLLGYVETGSMAPTMAPGDGFVVLPASVAGPPEEGDVIVFEAEQLNGGGLVTHRVVGETERGYVTRGDANPFTDQSAGEPPVRRPQIVGVAPRIGGGPIVIPGLGSGAATVRDVVGSVGRRLRAAGVGPGLWIGLGAAGLFVLLFGGAAERGRRERPSVDERTPGPDREWRIGAREFVLMAGAAVILAVTASAVLPLEPTEYRVVSAESDLPGPEVIEAGGSETTTYRVPAGGVVPTRYAVVPASEGVTVTDGTGVVRPGETANATVTLSVPPETGSYRRYVTEHRYPLVLPRSLLDPLYGLHPLAPVAAIDCAVAVPTLLVARLIGGGGRPRPSPSADRGVFGR